MLLRQSFPSFQHPPLVFSLAPLSSLSPSRLLSHPLVFSLALSLLTVPPFPTSHTFTPNYADKHSLLSPFTPCLPFPPPFLPSPPTPSSTPTLTHTHPSQFLALIAILSPSFLHSLPLPSHGLFYFISLPPSLPPIPPPFLSSLATHSTLTYTHTVSRSHRYPVLRGIKADPGPAPHGPLGDFYLKPTCVGLSSSRPLTVLNGSR